MHDDSGLHIRRSNGRMDCQPLSDLVTPRPVIFVSLKPAIKDDPPMGPVSPDLIPIDLLPGQNLDRLLD
jgi:hypothetical protein